MADLQALLSKATAALMAGDNDAATRLLSEVERIAIQRPELWDNEAAIALTRFSDLAHAAAEGIAEARALIFHAGENARKVNTYDDTGAARTVRAAKPALGRF